MGADDNGPSTEENSEKHDQRIQSPRRRAGHEANMDSGVQFSPLTTSFTTSNPLTSYESQTLRLSH